jgi:competence protein ComEC
VAFILAPFASNKVHLHVPLKAWLAGIDSWLDFERDQLTLWIPVGIGLGIGFWQVSGGEGLIPVLLLFLASSLLAYAVGFWRRIGRFLLFSGLAVLAGFGAIAIKSERVSAPVLANAWVGTFYGRVQKVELLTARDAVRLELATGGQQGLPPKVRVNLKSDQFDSQFRNGAIVQLRARLMPPAGPALPGGYDFAQRAWFQQIGATGSALGEVTLHQASNSPVWLSETRNRLSQHVIARMPGDTGQIGAALITGDQGNIGDADAQAMRNSGMAHLLSISGLHVTAVVGFVFLFCSRILALVPAIALRVPVPLIAAAFAALGAVGYTLLAGAEVPTVRSCVAALLILTALAIGRDALTLRLVAFGALVVLLFWPETMAGPSFQLSFAAVATIVILHESAWMKRWTERREEPFSIRLGRGLVSLIITGIAIELILAPIALFHFHRTGVYGALANVVAIPLTTFLIMPAQAFALMLDVIGLGAPFWWVAGQGISAILFIAHYASSLPGAVSMLPAMPLWAYLAMIGGALSLGLLKSKVRLVGLLPFAIGFAAMLLAPRPDLLVTGDGKHLAVVEANGSVALLRSKAGDYTRDMLLETAGTVAEPQALESWPGADCSIDICIIEIQRGGQSWRILATRTPYAVPSMEMAAACRRVDIVVSDRWLPASCRPRWIKADRNMLDQSGGLAFHLAEQKLVSVNDKNAHMPWVRAARTAKARAELAQ